MNTEGHLCKLPNNTYELRPYHSVLCSSCRIASNGINIVYNTDDADKIKELLDIANKFTFKGAMSIEHAEFLKEKYNIN